jgi:hypothetical protein
VGSNPTQGMDVYVSVVLCVGSGFATGLSVVQGVPPSVKYYYRTVEEARAL